MAGMFVNEDNQDNYIKEDERYGHCRPRRKKYLTVIILSIWLQIKGNDCRVEDTEDNYIKEDYELCLVNADPEEKSIL